MSELLRKTLEKLPNLFAQNANGMMQRLVAHMQQQMERDVHASNTSYLTLLLKMSGSDLALEFDKSVRAAMQKADDGADTISGGLSLELDIAGDGQPDLSMQDSDKAFRKLQEKGRAVGVTRLEPFAAKSMIDCIQEAMANARISATDIQALTPFARRALNLELLSIYQKLNDL